MARVRQKWERQIGEGARAYDVFLIYASLGAKRSAGAVADECAIQGHPLKVATISKLSCRFFWPNRAKAYDEHLLKIQWRAIENTVKDKAIVWAERNEEYREAGMSISHALLSKAMEMLQAPLYETQYDDTEEVDINGTIVVVPVKVTKKPVRWNYAQAVALTDLADKIKRLTLEQPTSRNVFDFNFTEGDPEQNLSKARQVFDHLLKGVDDWLKRDPSITREQVVQTYREEVANNFKVAPEMLIIEPELEPLPLEM